MKRLPFRPNPKRIEVHGFASPLGVAFLSISMSSAENSPTSCDYYSLTYTTRAVEDARLAMQAILGLEAELPILDELGLQGSSIHCLGAGPCFYESELFKHLAPRSSLASDIDPESIASAQKRNLNASTSFTVLDARGPLPTGFDVVAERFLLIQLSSAQARTVVSNMVESLSQGGRVILIEFTNSFCIPLPECEPLLKLRQVMMDRFRAHGADPDIGLRLEKFLEDFGLRDVRGYDVPYTIEGDMFNRTISLGELNFGTPADIIAASYSTRFEQDHPTLVRDFRDWLISARSIGSNFKLEHKYRIAVGTKC